MAAGRVQAARLARQAGKGMAILLIVVAVVSAAAGAAVVLLFPSQRHVPETPGGKAPEKRPPQLKMSTETLELAFNPPDKNRTRICKINVSFEILADRPEEADKLIVEKKDSAKSALLIHLSDVRVDQLLGSDNLNALRKELRKKCELLFFPHGEARLNDVFLGEVIVQ
jgi:flagellar basal body-associated protein FliL